MSFAGRGAGSFVSLGYCFTFAAFVALAIGSTATGGVVAVGVFTVAFVFVTGCAAGGVVVAPGFGSVFVSVLLLSHAAMASALTAASNIDFRMSIRTSSNRPNLRRAAQEPKRQRCNS